MIIGCKVLLHSGQVKPCNIISRIRGSSYSWKIILLTGETIIVEDWRVFISCPIYPIDYHLSQHK